MSKTLNRPLVSQANLGNSRWYGPHLFSHLVPNEATDGEATLIHFTGQAGGEPPLHIHTREDEFFYIIEGDFVFEAGSKQMQAKPGTFVWFPKDIEHGFKAYSSTGKGIIGFLPGAMEQWFIEFSTPADFLNLPPGGQPSFMDDIDAMLRTGNERGLEFLPPTVTSTKPNPEAKSQPFATSPEAAEKIEVPGMIFSLLATSAKTNGVLNAFELAMEPGTSSPLHSKSEMALVYILEGQTRYQLGDTLVEVGPGTAIMIPAGTPSAYRNIGPGTSRSLHMLCGGRFDSLIREIRPYFAKSEAGKLAAALESYGWKLEGAEIED